MMAADRELGVPASGVRVPDWSGLVAIDKPEGVTSHDVVLQVRRRLRDRHAGHLGTLDPGATGLLLVALGVATRCIPVWQGGFKTYEATVRFGVETSTQDLHGQVVAEHPVRVSEADVRAAAETLTGDILQVPPMVSALKVQGERLHRIARRGETVERKPRPVRVDAWEWLGFDLPEARFRVRVSGGTYVRTLAHDLGWALGCGGALAALRRLRSEPFDLAEAATLEDLARLPREEVLARHGIPLDRALESLPAVMLDADATAFLGFGGRPSLARGERGAGADRIGLGPRSIVARDPDGRAVALGELAPDPEDEGRVLVCPRVVFPWAVRQGRGGEDA